MKWMRKWLPEQGSYFLHVLNGGGEESLLAHVSVAAHAGIAKPVELFGVREGSFNRLFSPSVEVLSRRSFCEGVCLIQIVLPYMPRYLLSFVACCKALYASGAGLTGFCIAAILAVSFAGCVVMLEQAAFRTDIAVESGIVLESVFTVGFMFMGVSTIS